MAPLALTSNTLFYGDNLDILREYIASASVDLVYLDPHPADPYTAYLVPQSPVWGLFLAPSLAP